MKKKKIMWIIIVAIWIAACVLSAYILYMWVSPRMGGEGYLGIYSINFAKNETDSGWNLTVFFMLPNRTSSVWESQNIIYKLKCTNGSYWRENGTLESIKDNPSGYGIRWFDKDNDKHLSVGDVIFISKAGGPDGTVIPGGGYLLEIIVDNTVVYDTQCL